MKDPHAKPWAATLGQVIADLERLNHHTEQDFLRIGGKLAGFLEAVNLISSRLEALASLIAGEHGLRASQTLTAALDRSNVMAARAAEGNSLLGGMRREARRVKQNLSGYERTVATFRTLGVLTRIETARLGASGADFGYLADDVRSLAADVHSQVETALHAAVLLIPSIEKAMQKVAGLEEEQAKDLPSVISRVLRDLSSFRDMEIRVRDASVRLGARYDAISDAFKSLIVSIQFHDITRQQVEHVIEVLRGLVSQAHPDTAAVLALQSMQLADAGRKFAASAADVGRAMEDIARNVLEMAAESRALSGLSTDETSSFFLQIEGVCSAILANLGACDTAQAAIRATSGELAESIGRTRRPIDQTQSIGIRIHRMALNARIRAGHLGAAGDVLSVLAASMQDLATECGEHSASLVEALGSMSAAATGLSGQAGPTPGAQPGSQPGTQPGSQDGFLEGMRLAVAELHSSSERSFAQIAQIIEGGARLSEEVSAARQGFTAGTLFAEAVSRARGMLQEIGEGHPSGSSRPGAGASDRDLADFARHYTMQAERDVHQGIARAVAGAEAAPAPLGAASLVAAPGAPADFPPGKAVELAEPAELGDNVEFF